MADRPIFFSAPMAEIPRFELWRPGPYIARSASDCTDAWPFWYVTPSNDSRTNVLIFPDQPGAVFTDRETAEAIAAAANHNFGVGS